MHSNHLKENPYALTGMYYLAFIGLGLTTASFGPTLQGLAGNTGSTLAQISTLFIVRSFGYLLGSLLGGRVYDRVKGHPVISVILLGMVIALWGVPVLRSIYFLGGVLFLLGSFEGLLDVGCNTLLFWLHGAKVPPFMNGLHAFFGVGTTIAPVIVAQVVLQTQSITWGYWILGLLILPSALGLLYFKSPSAVTSSSPHENSPVNLPLLVVICLLFFLYVGSELGFAGWIYTYTLHQTLANPSTAASINAAFWAAFTVGRLASIPIAARVKPERILWVDIGGSIASLSLILLLPEQLWALWAGSIGAGIFMASIFPTILNDAQTRMKMSGNITSWFFVGASLGGMLLPFVIGQIIGPYGPRAAIFAVLSSMVGTCVLFGVLLVIRKTPPPPQLQSSHEAHLEI